MNSQTIVAYLEMVASSSLLVNFLMHVVALISIVAIFVSYNDKIRRLVFQAAFSVLFLSVTINAIVHGNPFHAVTFGILAVTALIQLFRGKENIEISKSRSTMALAFVFIFIGLWYPEFIEKNLFMLLFVSPVGVIPCPTLLTTLGLMTLVAPSLNRTQYIITAIMGLVYGVIGVFVFKVYLDITLLVLAVYSIYYILYLFNRNPHVELKS